MKKIILFILLFSLMFFSFYQTAYAEQKASGASAVLVKVQPETKIDSRATILENFLKQYDSPLAPHALAFVEEADANRIDWKLLVAISGVESTFARALPYESYNAWGWGIYGNNVIRFASYDEAIATISKALREKYMDKWGADNVYEIGSFYAASPTWAQRVEYFMNQIDAFSLANPSYSLSISI